MFNTEINTLLKNSGITLPQLVCAASLKHDIDELVRMALPCKKIAVIDDVDTSEAAGNPVFSALQSGFDVQHITLPKHPHADMETVHWLREQTQKCDALVAVGSGTINDLCKYVSALEGKPYLVFPTAASMNGYLSANASITENGYKKTCKAHMPAAVFCDLSIIAEAPARLNKSGLGDSLARPTAQADWLLSHLLLGTDYTPLPFDLLAPIEQQLFEQARGIARCDPASIELLLHSLLLSGLGMTIAGGSYPASQGEHMIAHAYEMINHPSRLREGTGEGKFPPISPRKRGECQQTLHGEQIGVTTLYMTQLQEKLLHSRPTPHANDFDSKAMTALFGAQVANEAQKQFEAKVETLDSRLPPSPRLRRTGRGNDIGWESIAERISAVTLPAAKIQSVLEAAEAPTHIGQLQWDQEAYDNACKYARFTRERFTFLDLQN